jgi:hypothetical protein
LDCAAELVLFGVISIPREPKEDIYIPLTNFASTIMSDQNNTPLPPEGELKFLMQVMTKMMERMNFVMANVCDRLDKEEKWRLRVLNIYDQNAFMMLDKEREAEQLAKVYKETNREREECRELQFRAKMIRSRQGQIRILT